MDYIAILVSLLALVGAGFAFLRANSSHNILGKRIETLKDRNSALEARLRKLEGNSGRGNKPFSEVNETGRETGRKNQPRPENQQEARQNKPRPEQQNEPRQKQRERQPQPQQQASPLLQPNEDGSQQPQQKRRKENRRRNEPMERAANYGELEREQPMPVTNSGRIEFAGGDLLDELEQAAGNPTPVAAPVPAEAPYTGKKYAIIPEDGVIRMHQLQQQPDSDSYIEVDITADGSSNTRYRFNLAGNHEFVIAQGIDRLENAFDFEKPSNRMVSKVVQQQDGTLTKVNNGWRIMEKARIDFR